MKKNVGGTFAALRILFGILMMGLSSLMMALGWITSASFWLYGLATAILMGAFLLVTGVLKRCPINKVLNRDTCN